jgi:hypothetical protein
MKDVAVKRKVSHFLESCFIDEKSMRMPRTPEEWTTFYCRTNDSWIGRNIVDYCFFSKLENNFPSELKIEDYGKCYNRKSNFETTRSAFYSMFEYNEMKAEIICNSNPNDKSTTDHPLLSDFKKMCKTYFLPDLKWSPLCRKITDIREREKVMQEELEMINCWTRVYPSDVLDNCWKLFTSHSMPTTNEEWREFLCQTKHHYAFREAVRYCSTIQMFLNNPKDDLDDYNCLSSSWTIPLDELILLKDYYRMTRDALTNMEFCLEEFPVGGNRIVEGKNARDLLEDDGDIDKNYYKNNKLRTLIDRFKDKPGPLSAIEYCWRTLTIIGDPEKLPLADQDWKLITCSGKNFTKTDNDKVLTCVTDILNPRLPQRRPTDWESRINLDGC